MSGSVPFELRPASVDDQDFLYRLYASTRSDELAAFAWSPGALEHFLRMQFTARQGSYAARHPGSEDRIIEVGGDPVGRLLVDRSADPFVLIDIALLPEARGDGVGLRLLTELQAQASAAGASVRLHVDTGNPARRLYERAGFRRVSDDALRICMEWSPT